MHKQPKITRFNENVLSKYQIYNSIFMTLPFDTISTTGVLLPLFHKICEQGFKNKKNPTEIVDDFFKAFYVFFEIFSVLKFSAHFSDFYRSMR